MKATVIAHSQDPKGRELFTLELEYPRFIHGEVMTHRQFNRNAASSRAIPAKAVRKQVRENPALPVSWGQNQSGMQAENDLMGRPRRKAERLWRRAGRVACFFHAAMEKVGLHKQVCNRILEPWMMMKVVVTATEWDNMFWLRDHVDAQPEFRLLARLAKTAMMQSKPRQLAWGDWHLPYVEDTDRVKYTLSEQKDISVSCAAQTSFRKNDRSIEKARRIVGMLTSSNRLHASPFEHQAQAVKTSGLSNQEARRLGFSHRDLNGKLWSANLKGFAQNRKQIEYNINAIRLAKAETIGADKLAA